MANIAIIGGSSTSLSFMLAQALAQQSQHKTFVFKNKRFIPCVTIIKLKELYCMPKHSFKKQIRQALNKNVYLKDKHFKKNYFKQPRNL